MDPLFIDVILILIGLVLLYFGAELLVRSSVSLGTFFGLSRLVIGMTLVAFATSAPEVVVSVQAALQEQGDTALGNVFGSNLANIGLILGLSACVRPLSVHFNSIRLDGPVVLLTAVLSGVLVWNGSLSRMEGLFLLGLLALLIAGRIYIERKESKEQDLEDGGDKPWPMRLALPGLAGGLLLLVLGGHWLVSGAVSTARFLNIPDAFVAMTVVAVGTSLPELSTSIVAAIRGNVDIAVGNVLGSNIFNICGVLGLSAVVSPITGSGFQTEIIFMCLMSLAVLPLLRTGFRIERWEGILLLVLYVGAILWLL